MRRTASQLSARHVGHLLAAALLFFSVGLARFEPAGEGTPFISNVRAADYLAISYGDVPDGFVPASLRPEPRASLPTPLPSPVPIDTDATPLPAPTERPVSVYVTPPTTLAWPVAGVISQYYSVAHLALDIAAAYGSPVAAAQAGTVIYAGWKNNGGGYVVDIDHGNGMLTSYNHLSAIYVNAGQYVAQGTTIAAVGMSGNATGPHLHFAVSVGGTWVNPLIYL